MILVLWIKNFFMSEEKKIKWALMEEMAQYMMYGIVFDCFLLFLDFMQTQYGTASENIGHHIVLMEIFFTPYVLLETVIGLLIPLLILVSPLKRTRLGVYGASLLVAGGVYGMRIWWVMGGQYMQTFY